MHVIGYSILAEEMAFYDIITGMIRAQNLEMGSSLLTSNAYVSFGPIGTLLSCYKKYYIKYNHYDIKQEIAICRVHYIDTYVHTVQHKQ